VDAVRDRAAVLACEALGVGATRLVGDGSPGASPAAGRGSIADSLDVEARAAVRDVGHDPGIQTVSTSARMSSTALAAVIDCGDGGFAGLG
jgi:hypothetical protein